MVTFIDRRMIARLQSASLQIYWWLLKCEHGRHVGLSTWRHLKKKKRKFFYNDAVNLKNSDPHSIYFGCADDPSSVWRDESKYSVSTSIFCFRGKHFSVDAFWWPVDVKLLDRQSRRRSTPRSRHDFVGVKEDGRRRRAWWWWWMIGASWETNADEPTNQLEVTETMTTSKPRKIFILPHNKWSILFFFLIEGFIVYQKKKRQRCVTVHFFFWRGIRFDDEWRPPP